MRRSLILTRRGASLCSVPHCSRTFDLEDPSAHRVAFDHVFLSFVPSTWPHDCCAALVLAVLYAGAQTAAVPSPEYDLLLKGGHVIDAKNNIDALMDVAIQDGKIAKVARTIPARRAVKTVNVTGMYVVPGLVDIHVHAYAGTGEKNSYAGDLSVYPDGFTFRSGVTTVVDAGSSGWRSFPDLRAG